MQKEHEALLGYDCLDEYDVEQAVAEGLVRKEEILPMMAVTTRKPQQGSDKKKKKVRAVLCGNFQDVDSTVP
eukprot:3958485-Amphidinium_carterae.1